MSGKKEEDSVGKEKDTKKPNRILRGLVQLADATGVLELNEVDREKYDLGATGEKNTGQLKAKTGSQETVVTTKPLPPAPKVSCFVPVVAPVQTSREMQDFLYTALEKAGLNGFVAVCRMFAKMRARGMPVDTAATAALTAVDEGMTSDLVSELQKLSSVLSGERDKLSHKLQANTEVCISKAKDKKNAAVQKVTELRVKIQELEQEIAEHEQTGQAAEAEVLKVQSEQAELQGEFDAMVQEIRDRAIPLLKAMGAAVEAEGDEENGQQKKD